MKKIFLSLLLVFALSTTVLAESFEIKEPELKPIPGGSDIFGLGLIYDIDTKIVYLRETYRMTIYYSKNGKLCKYNEKTKKLDEVE